MTDRTRCRAYRSVGVLDVVQGAFRSTTDTGIRIHRKFSGGMAQFFHSVRLRTATRKKSEEVRVFLPQTSGTPFNVLPATTAATAAESEFVSEGRGGANVRGPQPVGNPARRTSPVGVAAARGMAI